MKLKKIGATKADILAITKDKTITYRFEMDRIDNECRVETNNVELQNILKAKGFIE